LLEEVFEAKRWGADQSLDPETASLEMTLLLAKACGICEELQSDATGSSAEELLRGVARRLRYQIATREPFLPDESCDLQIATLWGAKGVTAEHVYVIGLCKEASPGTRREEHPGNDSEFFEEQRRRFYVSITRSKGTLVLSRSRWIGLGQASQLGLKVSGVKKHHAVLEMSPFLRDIMKYLPEYVEGEDWQGCS